MLRLFLRYASVGLVNTGIHWLVFVALYYLGLSQLYCNITAFFSAVTFFFVANANFIFEKKATSKRYFAYTIFMGSIAIFTGYFSDTMEISPIITLLLFSFISLLVGFLYGTIFILLSVAGIYFTNDIYTINTGDYYRVISPFISLEKGEFTPFSENISLRATISPSFGGLKSFEYISSYSYIIYGYAKILSLFTNTFDIKLLSIVEKIIFFLCIWYFLNCFFKKQKIFLLAGIIAIFF